MSESLKISPQCVIGSSRHWHMKIVGSSHIYWAGAEQAADRLSTAINNLPNPSVEAISNVIAELNCHFAVIIETPHLVIAAVDIIRTRPIFYSKKYGQFCIGSDAREVRDAFELNDFETVALTECQMAGYVTGSHTVYKDLFHLQAGECLIWSKEQRHLEIDWYFKYCSENLVTDDESHLIDALEKVTDDVIERTIAYVNGRPIWIPLSGGFDSRLILAKLVEHGYEQIECFSYGPPGNSDAEVARKIAERLGVPWRYVAIGKNEISRFHLSDQCIEYWSFADGLCSVPFSNDLLALLKLRADGELPDDAVIINGQTGDFTSGGHIPRSWTGDEKVSSEQLIKSIMDKHFGLRLSLMQSHQAAGVVTKLYRMLEIQPGQTFNVQQAAIIFEHWECRERQAKFVVNGQRTYDFLGLDWYLPLWDPELVQFWRDIPLAHKVQQRLFRHYFSQWNFRQVFSDFQKTMTAWSPLYNVFLVPLAIILRLLLGRRRRDNLFRYLKYFDRLGLHFRAFGLYRFLRNVHDIRSVISLYTEDWLAFLTLGSSDDGI